MTFKTINLMTALQELRELRNTIKAAEERITQISDQAIRKRFSKRRERYRLVLPRA